MEEERRCPQNGWWMERVVVAEALTVGCQRIVVPEGAQGHWKGGSGTLLEVRFQEGTVLSL